MGARIKRLFSFQDAGGDDLNHREDKFQLMSCPRNAVQCKDILPQVNQLYSESELARINKEYQRSIELLQQAYYKTLELNKPTCTNCVDLFHANIRETLETLHRELERISYGTSKKKRFSPSNSRMARFLEKINFFRFGEATN